MDPQNMPLIATAMVFLFVLITGAAMGLVVLKHQRSRRATVPSQPGHTVIVTPGDSSKPESSGLPPIQAARNVFWPRINDKTAARAAAKQAVIAALFCAAATSLLAFVAYAGLPVAPGTAGRALLDAAIFGGLGILIARMSRIAAVVALAVYVAERIYVCFKVGMPGVLAGVLMLIIVLCFVNGVRGTAAYEKFEEELPDLPAREPSLNPENPE